MSYDPHCPVCDNIYHERWSGIPGVLSTGEACQDCRTLSNDDLARALLQFYRLVRRGGTYQNTRAAAMQLFTELGLFHRQGKPAK